MADVEAQEDPQKPHGVMTVRAVITRKDGTVEDLGVISEGPLEFRASGDPS